MAKVDQKTGEALGTGRRKSSVARVRVKSGSGTIVINGKPLDNFFPVLKDQRQITDTLAATGTSSGVDVRITVTGGGTTGQAGACRMGIARALVNFDTEHFNALRDGGFLTRDSRMKERKKPGLHGARRGTQFSKR
jgi:small subunit ribosomal protein S9